MDAPDRERPAGEFAEAGAFDEHRPRLLALAARRMNPALARRVSPEDVVQETFAAAMARAGFFREGRDVPLYFKLRTVLGQTLADLERRHLGARKRDANREVDGEAADWDAFAATVTAPNSVLAREDRHAALRAAIGELQPADRRMIILRHFDDMDNAGCARVLGIEPKAASARYVRALERLQAILVKLTEFQC